jgi:hypothetical protein
MSNYYEKYLKYKTKYFELKEKINNNKISLLVGGNKYIEFYTEKIEKVKKEIDSVFLQLQNPNPTNPIELESLTIKFYRLLILDKLYRIKINIFHYNEMMKNYEEYKKDLLTLLPSSKTYILMTTQIITTLENIALVIFHNNQYIYNNNLAILKLYESLQKILIYKYKQIISENKLSYEQRDELEINFNKNNKFLDEQIRLATIKFEECKKFMGEENSLLFENIVKNINYQKEYIKKIKEENGKISTDLLKLYKLRSNIEPGPNATKLKESFDSKIKSLESKFFVSNSFTSGIELSSVDEVLKIFNSMNTDVKPIPIPIPISKPKSKPKSSSKYKPSASGSTSASTSASESIIPEDPDNIEENLDLLIKNSIDFADTEFNFPVQTITEEELNDFIRVEIPRRTHLFDIINFDKVHTYMELLEEEIQKLVGPGIKVNIKFKELTGDMIVIEFIDLSNNNEIAHFTFHDKIISKYDPVGPYHFKIDDGSRRYSNLTFERGTGNLSIENKEQFKDIPEIMLIIRSIEKVLNDNKSILEKK